MFFLKVSTAIQYNRLNEYNLTLILQSTIRLFSYRKMNFHAKPQLAKTVVVERKHVHVYRKFD